MFLHRFIGATVGAGKSPTWNKVIGEYGFMRKCMNLKDNVVALKGSKEQVEDTLIEHDGNVVFYTVESMIEDSMSAASAIDSKQLAHTVYDAAMCLINDGLGAKKELSTSGVTIKNRIQEVSRSHDATLVSTTYDSAYHTERAKQDEGRPRPETTLDRSAVACQRARIFFARRGKPTDIRVEGEERGLLGYAHENVRLRYLTRYLFSRPYSARS